jgi:HK97 family phage major capsid protein
MASEYRRNFAGWMNNALQSIGGGLAPSMGATAPTGTISIGTGSGLDSIAITVPTEVLNYLASYYALDSFGLAGATTFYTNDTRPLVKPILSAGSADAVYAEATAPGTSQPFGTSGFTFGGTKYGRLVLATYESLMNTELPLQGAIMDELLASLANTLTTATTTAFVAALAAASSTLEVGAGGSGGSVYTSMIDLRHAVPTRFDLPTNKWMLSRATLSQIRNTRATTSGIPMFDPNSNLILGREFVLNDNLDTTSGAGVCFVAYGSFADGVWLRRTPVQTRVFLELYAQNGSVGFRTQQWADAHFLAELVGAAQAPTFQPIYFTNIVSES